MRGYFISGIAVLNYVYRKNNGPGYLLWPKHNIKHFRQTYIINL